MRLLIATAALSAGLSGAASAQDFSLGTGISTLGPLVEGGVNFDDGFGLRAVATIPFDFDVLTIDFGADYDIDGAVNLGSAALLADY